MIKAEEYYRPRNTSEEIKIEKTNENQKRRFRGSVKKRKYDY